MTKATVTPEGFPKGLTYDDVLLIPQHSRVLPRDTELTTKFSRNLSLRTPLVSAAMDTVTESGTAITMARAGGIGIIHKNMSLSAQAKHVAQVKKSEAGIVKNPVTISPDMTLAQVIAIMEEKGFSGFPVVQAGRLVGIITGRDLRFEKDYSKKVDQIMTRDVVTASKDTSADEAVDILHQHRIEKLPVIDDDGKTLIGMYTVKDILQGRRFPGASKDNQGRLLVGASVGAAGDFLERTGALLEAGCDVIVVDTAHGHSQGVLDAVKTIKAEFKSFGFDLVGGNIATAAAYEALVEAGCDAVKVGIGPGSICTTRIVAGIGVPQLSAVLNCARQVKSKGVPIIADGGIKFSGDIVKALAAGAGTVMIGSLFAGTDEAPGDLIIYQGKTFKQYRGMGSLGAMSSGSKDRYFQDNVEDTNKLVPEGIEGRIDYRGPLINSIYQLEGGIRSAMGYLGARTIPELHAQANFVEISPAGYRESHVHDVYITREAPNYKRDR